MPFQNDEINTRNGNGFVAQSKPKYTLIGTLVSIPVQHLRMTCHVNPFKPYVLYVLECCSIAEFVFLFIPQAWPEMKDDESAVCPDFSDKDSK